VLCIKCAAACTSPDNLVMGTAHFFV